MPVIAAIDCGSNAIRLVTASVHGGRELELLDNLREPVRLGKDVFTQGSISEETTERALETFTRFRKLLDQRGATHARAVATSAVREAHNQDFFIDRITQSTGIQIIPIDPTEEARLVHRAVTAKIDLKKKSVLLVDIGGGSVEITLVSQGKIIAMESLKIGTVRLLQDLQEETIGEQRFNQRMEHYIGTAKRLITNEIGKEKIDTLVGVGGSIEALGHLRKEIFDKEDDSFITSEELDNLVSRFQAMTFEQRIQGLGLRPDRADVIVPASILLQSILQQAGVSKVCIPGVGVKDGLLMDIVEELYGTQHQLHREQVIASAMQLGRKYAFDENHALTVAGYAVHLFEQTRSLHNLDDESRLLLEVAALLHDIGHFVNSTGHHKHAYYLLMATPIMGLRTTQRAIVANVARYHRKSLPNMQHEPYRALSPKDRVHVSKLAALLRLADALDADREAQITNVKVDVKKSHLKISVSASGDLLLTKWALMKKAGLCEEVFGVEFSLGEE